MVNIYQHHPPTILLRKLALTMMLAGADYHADADADALVEALRLLIHASHSCTCAELVTVSMLTYDAVHGAGAVCGADADVQGASVQAATALLVIRSVCVWSTRSIAASLNCTRAKLGSTNYAQSESLSLHFANLEF